MYRFEFLGSLAFAVALAGCGIGSDGSSETGDETSDETSKPSDVPCASDGSCYSTCRCHADHDACVTECSVQPSPTATSPVPTATSSAPTLSPGDPAAPAPTETAAPADPPPPPPELPKYTIKLDPFTVKAGQEIVMCQNVVSPMPADTVIQESASFMSPGSHHMFVFRTDSGPTSLEECSGLEFGPYVHLSQLPEEHFTYPEGVGRLISKGSNFRILVHYFNTTSDPIHAEVSIVFTQAAPETVKDLAASFFFHNTFGILVMPQAAGQATQECTFRAGTKLIDATNHMHKHATHFSASIGSETLYETTEWSEPPGVRWNPALDVGGKTVNIRCDYQNDTDQILTYGESARTNEMCIFQGTFYPSPDSSNQECFK